MDTYTQYYWPHSGIELNYKNGKPHKDKGPSYITCTMMQWHIDGILIHKMEMTEDFFNHTNDLKKSCELIALAIGAFASLPKKLRPGIDRALTVQEAQKLINSIPKRI